MCFAGTSQYFVILLSRIETRRRPTLVATRRGRQARTRMSKLHQRRIGTFILGARTCGFLERPMPATAGKPFVCYEDEVAGVMQFDDSRVLHAREEVLDCAFYPLCERLDVSM